MDSRRYELLFGLRYWLMGFLALALAALALFATFGRSASDGPTAASSPTLPPAPSKPAEKPPLPSTSVAPAVEEVRNQPAKESAAPLATEKGTAAAGASSEYRIRSGDCLWKIAMRNCGGGFRWPELFRANRDRILDPDLIYPDQNLLVACGPREESRP